VLLVRRGVGRGDGGEKPFELVGIGVVDVVGADADGLDRSVVEHLALAGWRQDMEFVAQVAADRPGVGRHRHRLHAQALEGAEIGQHHDAVAAHGGGVVQVEGVAVLHQELAPAHHAEAGPGLVAELPLNMVEDLRQLAVAADRLAEQVGDQQLVGGAVDQVALVAVLEAQHLGAIGVVAARLAPQVGGLQGGQQQFLRADAVLLLPHHLGDVAQHAPPGREPGVDARRHLPHQPGPQHEPVRRDLRLRRVFLDGGQQGAGQAHGGPWSVEWGSVDRHEPYKPWSATASRWRQGHFHSRIPQSRAIFVRRTILF